MLRGEVHAVEGSVVEVRFAGGRLPSTREALRVLDGSERVIEVQAHLGGDRIRGLSLLHA